jgi:hypothetical protein
MTFSLTDHLRSLPDDQLAELIRLRDDLIVPVPADLAALAVRAQSRISLARALDRLDRFTLRVLDALRLTRDDTGAPSIEAVFTMAAPAGVDSATVKDAVNRLRQLCVLYGPDTDLRLLDTVDEVCPRYPAGLGRPAAELDDRIAALAADPAGLRRAVLAAPPPARAVLERLAGDSPLGTVTPASLAPGMESAVRWLVDAHLLARTGDDTVELPREIGLLLRRDTGPLGQLEPSAPPLEMTQRDPKVTDRAGAGQTMETVRSVDVMLDALSTEPAFALRSGGLAVRDLRRLAKVAGLPEATAALLLEVASSSTLLGELVSDSGETRFVPTVAYDTWRLSGLAARWLRLANGWLTMVRSPAAIGHRDERDRPINALSGEVERPGMPALRLSALGVLSDAPPGAAVAPDSVAATLAWQAPRRASRQAPAGVATVMAEAAALGITGMGALTGYSRHLVASHQQRLGLAGDAAEEPVDPLGIHPDSEPQLASALEALSELLPPPVDHVLLQADLTIVVPGPAEATLAAELALFADPDSPNVYRVTEHSIRRALDTGYVPSELHALFARRSRTPVPQALTYLVDDLARRHGGLRAGAAGGYLRGEEESLVAAVAADRRLAGLALRRIAPTVLISPYPVARILAALRATGYAPIAEDTTGSVVLARPKERRAPDRSPRIRRFDDPLHPRRLSPARLAGIVDQLRRGDATARAAQRAPASVRPAEGTAAITSDTYTKAIATLQEALRTSSRAWVGYVDAHGTPVSRLVRPISMGGGYLRAEDERTEMLHTFALHRIVAASLEDEG